MIRSKHCQGTYLHTYVIMKIVKPRHCAALQKDSTCSNLTHPHPLCVVTNFKSFLQRTFQCNVTLLSVLCNCYLIIHCNTNNVCGLSTLLCDADRLTQNSTIDVTVIHIRCLIL